MARGFKSIDQEIGWGDEGHKIGDFIQIDYGAATGWSLLCEYSRKDGSIWVVVERPISYRVHDEGELIAYWDQRSKEGVSHAFAYEIEESAYLDELRTGLSAVMDIRLRHFLLGGMDLCLEVISSSIPSITPNNPSQTRQEEE